MKYLTSILKVLMTIKDLSLIGNIFIYPSLIAKKLNITIPYIYPLISTLLKKGLITSVIVGKCRQLNISDKGVLACDHFNKFLELFGDD